ncbi:MAG TPA: ABC transporter permease, partial [Dehalococcoidia bacterium]|nr:ABC transporter permease [Dehalococcoidia bacterium]
MAKDIQIGIPSIMARAEENRGRAGGMMRHGATLIRRNPLGFIGLLIIVTFVLIAILAPLLAPFSPTDIRAGQTNEGLSIHHWFGTDRSGNDVMSRVIFGARISLEVAFLSVIGGSAIGTAVGTISGYSGGQLDSLIQRGVDTVIAFPGLLLLLIIVQALGPSLWTVIFAIAIEIIPGVARVVRGAALSEK